MQLKLTFKTNTPLSLPLGHHAAVQGMIYGLLSRSPEYSDFLHNTGYKDEAHSFKLFVFSTLRGHHFISKNRILYDNCIYLDIRSPKEEFCKILLDALQSTDSLELEHQNISVLECSFAKKTILSDSVDIHMLSPITLSTTYYENGKKKTRFLAPRDPDFPDALRHNTASKYKAAFGKEPHSNISLDIISLSDRDHYVTKFNNRIYINGWSGTYKLSGDPSLLTFLYDTGIGSRNSQGFGMFDPL